MYMKAGSQSRMMATATHSAPNGHRLLPNRRNGGPKNHEPERSRGDHVQGESQGNEIESAMHHAVHCSEQEESPRRAHIRPIDLTGRGQVENDGVEHRGQFEQVLQVVGRISHLWRRQSGQLGRGHLLRIEATREDEPKSPAVHVEPHRQREDHGREEWLEDDGLVHAICLSATAQLKCRMTVELSAAAAEFRAWNFTPHSCARAIC